MPALFTPEWINNTDILNKVFKKKLLLRFNKKILLIPLSLLIVVCIYYSEIKNVQKSGLFGQEIIKEEEIDYHLDSLNKERFTEKQKKPIRDYLKKEFNKYGYKVSEQNTGRFINLIANKGSLHEPYILVGAHYDTVPQTPGIDDNASGVSTLLTIAKYNQNPNVRFVAFDGEEYNLSGSRYYAKNAAIKPDLVIILETMGYYSNLPNTQTIPSFYNVAYRGLYNRLKSDQFRGNFSAAICTDNAKKFCNNYEAYGSSLGLKVYSVNIPGISFVKNLFLDLFRSDHTPFLLEGTPAVMITDTANFRTSNYHKPSDTRDTVNTEFITKQANTILSVISNIQI